MTADSLAFKFLVYYGNKVPHRGQWRVHAFLRKLFQADIDEDISVVRQGVRWLLNPSDFVHSDLFWLGVMDYWDVFHMKRLMEPGNVFFDVGANFGYYSIALAKYLEGRCVAHAFEPSAKTFERLNRHVEENGLSGCVSPHRMGLSDIVQRGVLAMDSGNSGAAHLTDDEESKGESVELTTLDQFCEEHSIEKIDLIKVDVEGHEAHFLKGAEASIARWGPTIFIELNPSALKRAGSSTQEVADILKGYGYDLSYAKRDTILPLEKVPTSGDYVNAICRMK